MNEYGIVFTGAMARAILEAVVDQLQGLLDSEIGDKLIREKVTKEIARVLAKVTIPEPTEEEQKRVECKNCKKLTPEVGKYCCHCGVTIR